MGSSTATGLLRSMTEGVSAGTSVIAALRDAAFKTLADFFFRQVAADEHEAAVALLAFLPGALVIAVEDHVDALKDEPVRVVLERQDALAAQDGWTVLGDEV